ncbi:3-deoxy-7-phosphoheptulonate synthase [Dethiosulfatarculus sandiegensis]|uniref:3-deoxy-7-phosphoheptulonate synthase n=1 Tax=Dethiosulfatarculus sandiegensis TaxID=1429043 RepID=A0A0D2JTG2_9BACT|nr:3-deoxy-7-phosphoheptulonate synthase [Dethiosulfatarculus sandiegensis]KIX12795.1 3-deoxy-7-phosphoheptulonate synthase [Dethiosulfatarculus sandiegensis]
MFVTMQPSCPKSQVAEAIQALRGHGLNPRLIQPGNQNVLGIVEEITAETAAKLSKQLKALPGVEEVCDFSKSWKLVSREFKNEPTTIPLGRVEVGSRDILVTAGPCAVESERGFMDIADKVASLGAGALRGGAFKPRTSPYSFRGLGEDGLAIMARAREKHGLPIITEVLEPEEVDLVAAYADVLQIGARNMQNFALLEKVGDTNRPVLLKRGLMSSLKELLLSAEYILARGNWQVMLCERGIRTFETETRNTLDLSAVPILKQYTHLPVVVDPSHAAGKRELVPSLAKAAVAAGADGILVEVHTSPDSALSDGRQSLTIDGFKSLMLDLKPVARAVGRTIPEAAS